MRYTGPQFRCAPLPPVDFSVGKENMNLNSKWAKEWETGENPSREKEIIDELLRIFIQFWMHQMLDEKSKSTKNRYYGALHSIGGYLVEQAIYDDEDANLTSKELILKHIGPYDGPLICHDNETWQKEIDMVSRKLHKYLNTQC